ncbi:SRPBCC domain-containing protein [Flavobacterium sp. K5-23]|uniref:SRPBCC family protein n=1 Tax=Flavobacterium sp. K5-23 TaxID=2746225 RepID=UPI00200F9515|nr:SRPBCC domain-containing protein [Flavobacterium sp. K5-23]UQD56961.1 SRPBCC domain-containing protein [Flavobacterium sp. K5-23]
MENFDWTKFTKKIAVKAPLSEIYEAWTKSMTLESWFLSKAVFLREEKGILDRNQSISKKDKYEWSWFLFDGIEKGKVTKANGIDHLQFTFAGECLVDVELEQEGDYVIVELTQKDIPTDDKSKRNIRLGCESGWSFYLLNLKSIFEGGVDLRNKNPNFKGMINS